MSLYVYPSVCLSLRNPIFVYEPVCLPVASVCMSFRNPIFVYESVGLPVCLSVFEEPYICS